MRKLVVVAVGLFAFGTFSVSQAAKGKNSAAEEKLISTEKLLFEAWKNHDMGPFKQNLTDDVMVVVGDGILLGRDKLIDAMTKEVCEAKSYSLGDMKVSWIDKDAAVLAYKVDIDAICGGKKSPSPAYLSSVWAKRNGKWLTVFHQESHEAPAP